MINKKIIKLRFKILIIYLTILLTKVVKFVKKPKPLPINTICIIYISGFGDILCFTEFYKKLRNSFPKAHLTACFPQAIIEIQKTLFTFDDYIAHKNLLSTYILLCKKRYDLVILPGWVLKNSLLALFSRNHAIIGFINDYSRKNDYQGINELETIGIPENPIKQDQKQHHLSQRANPILSYFHQTPVLMNHIPKKIVNTTNQILIHTGAKFEGRKWRPENYAVVISYIIEHCPDHVIVMTGSSQDKIFNEKILKLIPITKNIRNTAGSLSLIESYELVQRSSLFFGSDSGIMHMAALNGIPCLSLFGPNLPHISGPVGINHLILFHPLPCSGCHQRNCENNFLCMNLITTDEAIAGLDFMLKRIL